MIANRAHTLTLDTHHLGIDDIMISDIRSLHAVYNANDVADRVPRHRRRREDEETRMSS